jgi:hypothetical protein
LQGVYFAYTITAQITGAEFLPYVAHPIRDAFTLYKIGAGKLAPLKRN